MNKVQLLVVQFALRFLVSNLDDELEEDLINIIRENGEEIEGNLEDEILSWEKSIL